MTLTFYCNFLNQHQVYVADELFTLLGDDFHFVATQSTRIEDLKGGNDYSDRPYCISATANEDARQQAFFLARQSDVCVFGACSQEYAVERAKNNPTGLSFEMGERWLKRGLLNVLSPVLRRWWLNYIRYYRKANFYKLCSSAFAAHDDELLGCYKGRHFKWGYFTLVSNTIKYRAKDIEHPIRLMWCSRFISWKHPELPIRLAAMLKNAGYHFCLDLYGDGVLRPAMVQLSKQLGVVDYVTFYGTIPNLEIHQAMCNHDIFLFTSDRREGWGTVANESMSEGCLLIGSAEIGAVPYLVKNGETGMIFRSCDLDSLYEQVTYVLDNLDVRKVISQAGRESMVKFWSPENASKSLLQLIDDIQAGRETSIIEGPCSKA